MVPNLSRLEGIMQTMLSHLANLNLYSPQLMMLNGMSLLLMVMTLEVYKVQMMKGERYSLNIMRRPL